MGRRSGGAIFGKKKPREGLDYTERQLDILCDNIPLTLASLTELRNIIKKATERGDTANRETAMLMYEVKAAPDIYRPDMTIGEAKMILQLLTPWDINWT